MRSQVSTIIVLLAVAAHQALAFSASFSRRAFFRDAAAAASASAFSLTISGPAIAAPQIFTTEQGVKYAVTKDVETKTNFPQTNDIVAIEYTGYLADGRIFDATHAQGKSNALLFQLDSGAVIPGLNDMVANMRVGQKVQAILPANLAYGDKGVCIEDGECLVKPGATLVYDIFLKKCSVPPP